MRRVLGLILVLPILLAASSPSAPPAARTAVNPYVAPGPHPVASVLLTLHDATRNRDVPIKAYYPADVSTPCPVILFSHGLAGSREGYQYLAQAWASHGFVSIHLTHLGSDTSILFGSMNPMGSLTRAAADPQNLVNRPLDISFVLDQLPALNTSDAHLKGLLDTQSVGLAGHSFGAYTTLAVIGQYFPGLSERHPFLDKRIKAACAMSSPTPTLPGIDLDRVYADIRVPCLHLTGTLDDLPIGHSPAANRRIPFDHSGFPDTYLVTFDGADHMTFAGHLHRPTSMPVANGTSLALSRLHIAGMSADPATDPLFHSLTQQVTTAFFTATLKHDPAAEEWLNREFPKVLDGHGTFERKSTK